MPLARVSAIFLLSAALFAGPFAAIASAVNAPVAGGDGKSIAQTDPQRSTVSVGAGFERTTPGASRSEASGGGTAASDPPTCVWVPIVLTVNPGGVTNPDGNGDAGTPVAAGTPGTWYYLSCPTRAVIGDVTNFVPNGQQPAQVISPQMLAEEAEKELQLVAPAVQLSPAPSPTRWEFVNVPTWVWLTAPSWAPLQASATAGPVTVTATATPKVLLLSYQDGPALRTVSCAGPGTPYSDALAKSENPATPLQAASPDCGWTYKNSSASAPDELESVSGSVSYEITWTVTGAGGGGDLGSLQSPATTYEVKVGEVQALITGVR